MIKKFICSTLLFLLPVFLPLLAIEGLLRNIPNDYKLKNQYMLDNGHKIETLILGSSHAHLGINPRYIDSQCYNLSCIGENIEFTYKLFERFSTYLQNLKTVIIPISYHSLYNKSLEKKWLKNYSIYYNLEVSDFPVDNFEIFNKEIPAIFRDIQEFYIEGNDSIYIKSDSLGWHFKTDRNTKDYAMQAKKIIARHSKNKKGDQVETNLSLLSNIIDFCKEKDVSVLFITTPFHSEYRQAMAKEQWQTTVSSATGLAEKNKNVFYYNFSDDIRFEEEHFHDVDHLNAKGAKLFSAIMNDIIENYNVIRY